MADRRNYPKLEYVDVEEERPIIHDGDVWGDVTPIAPCTRCQRLTEDPSRDWSGKEVPAHIFDSEEQRQAVCLRCRDKETEELNEAWSAAFEADILRLLEEKLSLTGKEREALKDLIQTLFTDAKKIIKLQELDNKVGGLEKQVNNLWVAFSLIAGLLAIVIGLLAAGVMQ